MMLLYECCVLCLFGFVFAVYSQDTFGERYGIFQDSSRSLKENFKIIWNLPTFVCQKQGVNFSPALESWGLLQNSDGMFRGDLISLLYDPGNFPALLDSEGGKNELRNGGIPQEGNMTKHIDSLRETLSELMPDRKFNGIGVIDFEHWRPIWRENWGILDKYRKYSVSMERKKHPKMSKEELEKKASKRFEAAAKQFMLQTIIFAKKLFPRALWGYYGYPFCFNYKPRNGKLSCTGEVIEDNDRSTWLFKESTALFPSMYLRSKNTNTQSNIQYIDGRMKEARRIAGNFNIPIYAYASHKYTDSNTFLSPEDLKNSLLVSKRAGADGVIIWGASKDLSSQEKCSSVYDYLMTVIGPAVKTVLQDTEKNEEEFQGIFNIFGR